MQLLVDRDDPTAVPLGRNVGQIDEVTDLTIWCGDHRPLQTSNFLCAKSCTDRQKEDGLITKTIDPISDIAKDCIDLLFREDFRLFAECHFSTCYQYLTGIWYNNWQLDETIISGKFLLRLQSISDADHIFDLI